ncbi:DNA-directed RNA polymerase I and III 14 KDA polypeptide [Glonium stellatum]|uniref:DNA-directed RNA polymerases I and III subunit RPAC2 n=1 Tax=Glonium stellatum TaxID=574774 RepID=A0A8E2JRJ4_9PEZI|nr:DNA-directed RNA polymerase I and III 14 KDA polypeptide [Glonium stellatum]
MSSQTRDEDQVMEDALVNGQDGEPPIAEEEEEPEKQGIRVLPGSTDTAASFEFEKEDHTLGNALRYIIMKNPDVEFCGYSIPHPSEERMNIRIQTYDNVSVYDVIEKGLNDLMDLCDVVMDKFTIARDEFAARQS